MKALILLLGVAFASAGAGASFFAPGLTTMGAGMPINVALDDASERTAGAGELGDAGGLLEL